MTKIRSTTILAVKKDDSVAIAGDGQVTLQHTIIKSGARKIRTLLDGRVCTGFAGSTADAFTLFERFEAKLNEYSGNLMRSSVELAKEWRTDRALRRLEALLIVADKTTVLTLSGTGDVIEPDDGIAAIGSGGSYAMSAARALMRNTNLSAKEIVVESMKIAGEICIYTNNNFIVEEVK